MNFFEEEPRPRPLFPVPEKELHGYPGRPWTGAPTEYIVPAILPWSLPLGRSERTIVALRNIDVWPESLTLRVSVYSRDNLLDESKTKLVDHRRVPDRNALLIGVLFADGRRAGSDTISMPSPTKPDTPVLRADSGGGSSFHFRHDVFIWPLPPDGPMQVVVQWLEREIEETRTELDGTLIRKSAADAKEIWPGLPKRVHHGLPIRRVTRHTPDASDGWSAFGAQEPGGESAPRA
ncbi:hypothetical protein [Amycolatopsis sp. NPDC059657]|uniref:hypothetical protein n=1 Tax=Amycolatopsis sp. NPDC059657 TaxID=3346899 RepID=UPI00366C57AA